MGDGSNSGEETPDLEEPGEVVGEGVAGVPDLRLVLVGGAVDGRLEGVARGDLDSVRDLATGGTHGVVRGRYDAHVAAIIAEHMS